MSDVNDAADHEQEPSPQAPGQEEAPAPPPVAVITITFLEGSLNMGVNSSGLVSNSHLWAASALLGRIADQMWIDGQSAARAKAMQERQAITAVRQQIMGARRT